MHALFCYWATYDLYVDLDQDTDYTDNFRDFTQSFQTNVALVIWNTLHLLPPQSFKTIQRQLSSNSNPNNRCS